MRTPQCTILGSIDKPEDSKFLKVKILVILVELRVAFNACQCVMYVAGFWGMKDVELECSIVMIAWSFVNASIVVS